MLEQYGIVGICGRYQLIHRMPHNNIISGIQDFNYFSYHVCGWMCVCAFEDTPIVAPLISMDVELEAMVAFRE